MEACPGKNEFFTFRIHTDSVPLVLIKIPLWTGYFCPPEPQPPTLLYLVTQPLWRWIRVSEVMEEEPWSTGISRRNIRVCLVFPPDTPPLFLSLSDTLKRKPSTSREAGPRQKLNWPAPWPSELLGKLISKIFCYDNHADKYKHCGPTKLSLLACISS
jgi:hypothetical protein